MAAYLSSSATLVDGTLDSSLGYNLPLPSSERPRRHRNEVCLPDTDNLTLALVMTMQKCLDPQALLNHLYEFIADFLPVRDLAWQNDQFMIATSEFDPHDEMQRLALCLPGEDLGDLVIDTQRPLYDEEVDWFGRLIEKVLYPLRNVCLYQQALASAERDPLTSLKNRRAFDTTVVDELARYTRYGTHSTLVVIDMMAFKAINDTWGHDVGDDALIRVGEGLRHIRRETDQVFRLGGDEFAAVLPATTAYGAQRFADRLTHWLSNNPLVIKSGEAVNMRASIGYAQTQQGCDAKDWFRRADQELYSVKRSHGVNSLSLAG